MHSCKSRGWLKACKHHKEVSKRKGWGMGGKNLKPAGRQQRDCVANFPLWTHHTVSVLVWSALLFLELFTLKMRFSFLICSFLTFTLSVHPFRNWCPHTVTKTVTCQVQNGTILQRVYQTCRWPQGCTGGRWGGEGSLLPLYHWDVKDLKRGTHLKLKTTTVEVPCFLFGIMFFFLDLTIVEFNSRKLLFLKISVL